MLKLERVPEEKSNSIKETTLILVAKEIYSS